MQDAVFRCRSPLDLSFLFQIQDILRQRTELFLKSGFLSVRPSSAPAAR